MNNECYNVIISQMITDGRYSQRVVIRAWGEASCLFKNWSPACIRQFTDLMLCRTVCNQNLSLLTNNFATKC